MKLSIITINLNNSDGLKDTMMSVFSQSYTDFEYIVIDGASTDGSLGLIRENANKLDYWISEKDTGIYNAMNKGIRASSGEYLLFLNSGDYFVNNSVISNVINELDGIDIVQGNVIIGKEGDYYIHRGYGHSDISFIEAFKSDFPHQGTFSRKVLFEKYGYFDESFSIVSDTIFYIKALALGEASFKYIDLNIAFFSPGGISEKQENLRTIEEKRLRNLLFSSRLIRLCTFDEKKIALYDKLHNSKFLWIGTMALVHIYSVFHKSKKREFVAQKFEHFNINN